MESNKKTCQFWIPHRLPGLNELLGLKSSRYKGAYNSAKRSAHGLIAMAIFAAELDTFESGAFLSYDLVEPNQERDPGNIFAGASKLIEDSLVTTRVLLGDGWRGVLGYRSVTWRVGELPGVLVTLEGP